MSGIPDLIRRLPKVFYVAAAVMFVWQLGNAYAEMSMLAGGSGFDEQVGAMTGLAKSRTLQYAIQESLYMVANGAIVQVLIAIYDRMAKS
ncbi:MAG: hypothetical protein KA233_00740 [Novosphingobium sp.]|jgi:hypothetical protein|nr:hypothetical protein [Novosphingobium sp.]MBP6554187.1 hypothetical protein [Novosphingobium sp.]